MSTDSPLHVIVISSVRPEPSSAGQIILHRHLVDQPGITLQVYGEEPQRPGFSRLVRRLVGRLSHTRLRRWAESFWVLWEGRWLDGELPCSIAHPEQTVVLTVAHGDAFMAAQRFAKRYGLPLVAIFHDWWPDIPPAHRSLKRLLEKRFRNLYHASDIALCVCPGMRRELGEHPNSQVLYPIPAAPSCSVQGKSADSASFRVLYAGNLADYGSMLGDVLEASLAHPEILIQVRGTNPAWSKERKQTMRASGRWLDFARRTELDEWLASADAFLVPMSFDPTMRRRMETSFPSKLLEFAQFGKPLVVWGPPSCSCVQWAEQGSKALTIADPDTDMVAMALVSLAKNRVEQARLGNAARNAALAEFNPKVIHCAFQRHLNELNHHPRP